jgi:hypothetical protein
MRISIKRIISCFLILFICPLFVSASENEPQYVNYYGVEMTNEEYTTLVNLGFNEYEIYHMDLETFNANKDLDATLLSREQKYYKTVTPAYGNSYDVEVTKEEYDNAKVLLRDTQVTIYKTITTTISANGSKYRYKISVSWNSIPSVKKYDITGIGFLDDVHVYNSIVYFRYYYTINNTDYSSTQYYDEKVTSFGATKVYKIPDNIVGLSSILYFDVVKDTGVGTITSLSICGDYSHATSNSVTSTLAAHHSIGYGGIGLFADNITLYDAIPCTYANVSGISW